MQERGNRYIPRCENDSFYNTSLINQSKKSLKRTDEVIAQIDEVITSDTESYIERKKAVLKDQEISGSEAFRFGYDKNISKEALYEDIVSYLGEYRFEVPEYKYKQRFSKSDDDPNLRLRGEKEDKSMIDLGKNAIQDKEANGEDVGKVKADLVGMQKVESLLANAKTGDRIVYASPPDPEYGYEYGFFYDGRVEELQDGEKILHLRALRLENSPNIEDYNKILSLMTGDTKEYTSANQCIENPEHINKALTDTDINKMLESVFHFESSETHALKFQEDIRKMEPYISGVIDLIKNGAPINQIQQSFHALENLALELKKRRSENYQETVIYSKEPDDLNMGFADFVSNFGYKPPEVQGSCGSSGGRNSNNIFGSGSIFTGNGNSGNTISSASSDEMKCVTCPFCTQMVDAIVTETSIECPSCGEKVNK
jgi:hypothetical protein